MGSCSNIILIPDCPNARSSSAIITKRGKIKPFIISIADEITGIEVQGPSLLDQRLKIVVPG